MTEANSRYKIYLAPMQGFTDHVYRNNFATVFGEIDKYFCPYLSYEKPGVVKKSQLKDIMPGNNVTSKMIPQILFSDVEEFKGLVKEIIGFGYSEINLNMGCPYPMVTNRGRGAALLQKLSVVDEVLKITQNDLSVAVSIKLRSGLESDQEIFRVVETINQHQISEIVFHPRVAKQMYKGNVDVNLFKQVADISTHPMVYNGDILCSEDIKEVLNLVPTQSSWMIGRGILQNPFLAQQLKGIENRRVEMNEKLARFHEMMFSDYASKLEGNGHLLQKMEQFWSYFSASFTNQHKTFKLIKKANSIEKYNDAVHRIFADFL